VLDYERLDVYRAAIEFLEIAFTLVERIPRGYGSLSDQLRRAGMSIPLNIAEGAGKSSAKDRAHFHAIARGSAMECGAILDVVSLLGVGSAEVAKGKQLLERTVSMLSKMCR
jgi:four helix bundle protein